MFGVTKLVVGLAVVLALALTLWSEWADPPTTTRLEIEFSGGFAYVPTPGLRMLEVAYLNDVELKEDTDKIASTPDEIVCKVDQVGTQMMVVRGEIVSFSPSSAEEPRLLDLDQAVVTFPGLESANLPLTYNRTPWAPTPLKPVDPGNAAHWTDLQYVPSIKDQHPGTDIMPGWRGVVNGRFVLKGGKLAGTLPSDPTIQGTHFNFKLAGVARGSVAVTDKTRYTVDVPGNQVEIHFNPDAQNIKSMVIKPNQPGEAVRLRVKGLHAMGTGARLADGEQLSDACAFYQLLQPRPAKAEWLTVHYSAPAASPGGGQPSPGYFCSGESF